MKTTQLFVVRAQPTLNFVPHINISFFAIYNSSNMFFFLLDYNKIHKKPQKFSAFDIVEPWSKEMRLVSYITCIDLIAQVFLT